MTEATKTLRKISKLIAKRDQTADVVRMLDAEITRLTRVYESETGYRMLQPHNIRNIVKQELGVH